MFYRKCLPIFASCVRNSTPLARGIQIAVAAMTCSIRIRLLLEVDAILLLIGSSELSISGQITLLTDDGRRFGILVIVLAGSQGHQGGQCKLSRIQNLLYNQVFVCCQFLNLSHYHLTYYKVRLSLFNVYSRISWFELTLLSVSLITFLLIAFKLFEQP